MAHHNDAGSSFNIVDAKNNGIFPDKAQISVPNEVPSDSTGFSRSNVEGSSDIDLDSLLQELCSLEDQLNATSTSTADCNFVTCMINSGALGNGAQRDTTTVLPVAKSQLAMPLAKPSSEKTVSPRLMTAPSNLRPHSPGNDSAFCDSGSLTSSESIVSNNNHSTKKEASTLASAEQKVPNSQRHSTVNISDTVSVMPACESSTDVTKANNMRAEKIKIALDKMREANVKKIHVKFFYCGDSKNTKNILIDERWTVSYATRYVAEQFGVPYSINHALLEVCPDLHFERIYEDHELLVENVLLWTKESTNEIHLIEKSAKYDLFYNPQHYLLNDGTTKLIDSTAKQRLIMEFFSDAHLRLPDMSGLLYLKSDGKKSWKKFYFTLRLSGLYVCTKGPKSKSSKDLICLSQLENIHIYTAVGWKKKYKAPNDFGFALKHPKIQVKSSKYVKYLCAENEEVALQWVTALRLAKFGKQLFDNFAECCELITTEDEISCKASSTETRTADPVLVEPPAASCRSDKATYESLDVAAATSSDVAHTLRRRVGRARRSTDNVSAVSSSGCSARDSESATEVDDTDDEEPPPSDATASADFFPPPPPPATRFDDLTPLGDITGRCRIASRDFSVASLAAVDFGGRAGSLDTASLAEFDTAAAETGTVRRRKPPPPTPPKRSETTRLSTVSMASSSHSLAAAMENGDTVLQPPSPVKPPLPVKPKLLPAPPVRTSAVSWHSANTSPIPSWQNANNGSAVAPKVTLPSRSLPKMEFKSELQLAMQRRMQRLQNLEDEQTP